MCSVSNESAGLSRVSGLAAVKWETGVNPVGAVWLLEFASTFRSCVFVKKLKNKLKGGKNGKY